MTFKNQIKKLKENWLLVSIVVVAFLFVFFAQSSPVGFQAKGSFGNSFAMTEDLEYASAPSIASARFYGGDDFAPEIEERKITLSASLTSEVKRGTFEDAQEKLKSIVTASDSFITSENVGKYGVRPSFSGHYQIKVESEKYASVLSQLKEIGEITSLNENAQDITGRYTNTQIELDVEKERLKRYNSLYKEAKTTQEKLDLNDRIFNQERRVKYLEDSLKNQDRRVEYTTISVNIQEKQSEYVNVVFVKFSDLVRSLVNSVNGLLKFLFVLLPYGLVVLIGWFVVRRIKRR